MKVKAHSSNETKFGELKFQLKILNNCISSKNFKEIRFIYLPSNKVEILMGRETVDIIDELF